MTCLCQLGYGRMVRGYPPARAVGGSQGMAVGAEQAQIFKAVVGGASIDVVKFQWNCGPQPLALEAMAAARFEPALTEQPLLEAVTAHGGGVEQLGQAAFGAKTATHVPAAPCEVAGVEPESLDRRFHLVVVAAGWLEAELHQHLPNGSATGDSLGEIGIAPASAALALGAGLLRRDLIDAQKR